MHYVIAAGAAAFGTVYLIATLQLPELRISEVIGPKVFPALIAVGIMICAVIIAFEGRAKARAAQPTEGDAVRPRSAKEMREATRRMLAALALLAFALLYATLLETVGYLILTPIFIMAIASFFNRGAHVTNALVAIGFGVGVYFLFNEFLGVRLPLGLMDTR